MLIPFPEKPLEYLKLIKFPAHMAKYNFSLRLTKDSPVSGLTKSVWNVMIKRKGRDLDESEHNNNLRLIGAPPNMDLSD